VGLPRHKRKEKKGIIFEKTGKKVLTAGVKGKLKLRGNLGERGGKASRWSDGISDPRAGTVAGKMTGKTLSTQSPSEGGGHTAVRTRIQKRGNEGGNVKKSNQTNRRNMRKGKTGTEHTNKTKKKKVKPENTGWGMPGNQKKWYKNHQSRRNEEKGKESTRARGGPLRDRWLGMKKPEKNAGGPV